MSKEQQFEEDHIYDYLIIGAGPAGIQMGYFFERDGRDYLVLEAEEPGAFFTKYPRHGNLISANKRYTGYDDPEVNLRFDWNSLLSDDEELRVKNYSKDYFPRASALVEYLRDFVDRTKVKIQSGVRVKKVSKDEHFELMDDADRTWRCRRLVVATGVSKPYLPPIDGIELTENYCDAPVDAEDFANQRVLIIGKGNSGFEIAENLIATTSLLHIASPNPVRLAWKTHHPGHLRAINNSFLDTYQLKTQNAVLDGTIEKIEKDEDGRYQVAIHYTHADEENEILVYDRVITCTGFRFDASIFDDSCRPALWQGNRLPELTSEYESTNVPGLFFAGTLMQMRDYKKSSTAFIHGFRYNCQALHRMLGLKHHETAWPSKKMSATPEKLVENMFERINQTSALWQLFGYLGDLYVLSDDGSEATFYPELPLDYIQDSDFSRNQAYFVVTLEFGHIKGDPFNILRQPDPTKAERSTFLHPVVRLYYGKEEMGDIHLLENLLGEWWDPELHVKPLLSFVTHKSREIAQELLT